MAIVWTKDKVDFLRANAPLMGDRAIALAMSKLLGEAVSYKAVYRKRQKLGIEKRRGRYKSVIVASSKKDRDT